MEFKDFISQFEKAAGQSGLGPDSDGHAAFSVSGIVLNLQHIELADTLVLYCTIQKLPQEKDETLWRALLEMNYLYQGTRGATVSLKPDTDEVVLTDKVPRLGALNFDEILNVLTNFINAAKTIQAMLAEYRGPVEAPAEFSSLDTQSFMRI